MKSFTRFDFQDAIEVDRKLLCPSFALDTVATVFNHHFGCLGGVTVADLDENRPGTGQLRFSFEGAVEDGYVSEIWLDSLQAGVQPADGFFLEMNTEMASHRSARLAKVSLPAPLSGSGERPCRGVRLAGAGQVLNRLSPATGGFACPRA